MSSWLTQSLRYKAAELWHPSTSGSLGYAWLASSSLRTAFDRLVRFLKVTTEGVECRIEEENSELSVVHSFNKETLNIPQIVDAHLALLVALCRTQVHILVSGINYRESLIFQINS